jgi:hypothetical protein
MLKLAPLLLLLLLQNPSISKGKWTPQEDELLAQLVDNCGVGRW